MSKKNNATAAELIALIARRFSGSEWAFFRNVPSTTGTGSRVRRADAVALNLYPSRGLELHGFEVKASRADWLRELKHPEKAEEICQFCDRWWVVIPDRDVVKDGELPPTWGLMVKRGRGLCVAIKAPKIQAEPMDRPFTAVLLRMSKDWRQSSEEHEAALRLARSDGARAERETTAFYQTESERLKRRIDEFEKASGVNIQYWQAWKIGAAVRMILKEPHPVLHEAKGFLRSVERLRDDLLEAITELEAFKPKMKGAAESQANDGRP